MVDIIRLDHFIGYAKYYRIPITDQTAHNGEWIQAPGDKLFQVLDSTIIDFNVIVEDLGDVTADVIKLRETYHFPGMRILQFELGQMSLAENFLENSVVCTGTHDNDTILGWYQSLPEHSINVDILSRDKLREFFECSSKDIHWKIINYALSTASNTVTIPLQDVLGENSSARFNTPGTLSSDNWSWRMEGEKLTKSLKTKLAELTKSHKRNSSAINNSLKEELESWK
jgi:4-alpha-glucanotransferase